MKNKNLKIVYNTGETRDEYNFVSKKIANCEKIFGQEDLEQMLDILKKLNYINSQGLPEIKTRVARELGGGAENIYLCELIHENIMEPLEPAEIVALISVFVGHGRSKNEPNIDYMDIPETLKEAVSQVKEIFDKIKKMETEASIDTEFEPNFLIIKPLYEWALGREFIEICEYTEVLEGAIVRSIQRVEQTLKSVQRALAFMGNQS